MRAKRILPAPVISHWIGLDWKQAASPPAMTAAVRNRSAVFARGCQRTRFLGPSHPTHPKRQLDRFSHFCVTDATFSVYTLHHAAPCISTKICPDRGGPGPPFSAWAHLTHHLQTAFRASQLFFQNSRSLRDVQTERTRNWMISKTRPLMLPCATRLNNNNNNNNNNDDDDDEFNGLVSVLVVTHQLFNSTMP